MRFQQTLSLFEPKKDVTIRSKDSRYIARVKIVFIEFVLRIGIQPTALR